MPIPLSQNYNPNFNYKGKPNYGYPDKKDKIGILIGTLLGAGMGAASGNNLGDSLLRGTEAGIFSYGTGLDKVQDYNTGALQQQSIADRLLYEPEQQAMERGMYDLAQKKFKQSVDEYEETEKPLRQVQMNQISKYGTMGEPPRSIQEYEYGQKLPQEQRPKYDEYALGISVPILADRAARGDKQAQSALAQVNVPQLYNSDQGVKLVNRRTNEVTNTGLTQKPEISNEAVKEIGSTKTLLQIGNDLIDLSTRVSMGPAAGRLESMKGNWFNGLSTDDQLEFNTTNQQLFNMIGVLRSGKVITENEYSRLMSELPNVNLPFNTYKVRLNRFNKILNRDLGNRLETYNQANYNAAGIDKNIPQPSKDPMQELIDLAKSGDQEAIQYLQSKGLNK